MIAKGEGHILMVKYVTSVLFEMSEILGTLQRLQELPPILHMRVHVGQLRPKYIAQPSLPQEYVGDDPQTSRLRVVGPHLPEPEDSRQLLLDAGEVGQDRLVRGTETLTDLFEELAVVGDESDDGLAEVFGHILGLVGPHFPLLLTG